MKKIFAIVAVLIGAIFMNASHAVVSAESSGIQVVIDGETQHYNVAPVNSKGSILVPMRAIFDKFKATMIWDGRTQQVSATKGSIYIVLTINSPTATINGKAITLDTVPQLINGSTMIPLRIVGETFGANVQWVSEKNMVNIVSSSNEKVALDNQSNKIEEGKSSQLPTLPKSDPISSDSISRNLSIDELNTLLLAISQKSEGDFNHEEVNSLHLALAMDKFQIFEMLVGQYNNENPDAQKNYDIHKFFKQYFVNELPLLTKYSINNYGSEKIGYAINRIINAMPDDPRFKAMSEVLEEHPNPQVRYNAAYLISKFNSEEAFNELAKVVSSEKDGMVFGNVVAAAIKSGGSDKDKISIMFQKYNDLSSEFKSSFSLMLFSISIDNTGLKSAWIAFLDEKLTAGSEIERKNSKEIINNIQ